MKFRRAVGRKIRLKIIQLSDKEGAFDLKYMEKSPEEILKKEQTMVSVRKVWMFLTPLFAFLALFNLYNWTQGSDSLTSLLSMTGMTFVGIATITGSRNKPLSYVFIAIGAIAVLAGLVSVIYDFQN